MNIFSIIYAETATIADVILVSTTELRVFFRKRRSIGFRGNP